MKNLVKLMFFLLLPIYGCSQTVLDVSEGTMYKEQTAAEVGNINLTSSYRGFVNKAGTLQYWNGTSLVDVVFGSNNSNDFLDSITESNSVFTLGVGLQNSQTLDLTSLHNDARALAWLTNLYPNLDIDSTDDPVANNLIYVNQGNEVGNMSMDYRVSNNPPHGGRVYISDFETTLGSKMGIFNIGQGFYDNNSITESWNNYLRVGSSFRITVNQTSSQSGTPVVTSNILQEFLFDDAYNTDNDVVRKINLDAELSALSGSGDPDQTLSINGDILTLTSQTGNQDVSISSSDTFDKSIVLFGDSITANETAYVDNLESIFSNATFKNFAVAGQRVTWNSSTVESTTTITNGSNDNRLWNSIKKWEQDHPTDEPDIIIIVLGTNDYASAMGSYSDAYAQDVSTLDHLTLANATRKALYYLRDNHPEVRIFWSLPTQSAVANRPYLTIYNIGNLIRTMCNRLGVTVIESTSESGIIAELENDGSNGKMLSDGLHFNTLGGEVFADYLSGQIKNQF